jgi:hypothetical protein
VINSVLKSRPANRSTWNPVDPGLRPIWVEVKTRFEIGPEKPGRPGSVPPDQIRVRPGQFFFIIPVIKRRRFGLLKGQNAKN